MDPKTKLNGSCLCGSVRFSAQPKSNNVDACHCVMCRKWGGGPFFSAGCGDAVNFEGVENITVFNSSKWAERGFCQKCGTHLFYRLKHEEHYAIPIGLFDSSNNWVLTEQIFIEQKPAFYSLGDDTKKLTGAEVFAQYTKK